MFSSYDSATFEENYICEDCGNLINITNECKNIHDDKANILWLKCNKCNALFLCKLKVTIRNENSKPGSRTLTQTVVLYSPYVLCTTLNVCLRDIKHININTFKNTHKDLFWNSIWYFKLIGLDYKFILPYDNFIEITTTEDDLI
jgi:hypothetical protein